MLVKSKEDITLVLVNLLYILSWNKYYNMTFGTGVTISFFHIFGYFPVGGKH